MKVARIALALALTPLAGTASAVQPRQETPTNILCTLAIYAAMEEIGRQCFPGKDPELQAELHDGVDRLSKHVLAKSNMTPAALEAMLDQVAERKQPNHAICQETGIEMYENTRDHRSELRGSVDKAIAEPGPPGWDPCL